MSRQGVVALVAIGDGAHAERAWGAQFIGGK